MDFKNAPKKRTTNFREDETKLLIQLWGSPTIQNKLYLTHRKAPVMRLMAAHMQKHGFCRTPDEIKTRIRNLKCLYHRIKKSMTTGAGIGTVDPDWPHYKAMDEILSRKNAIRQSLVYNHNLLSEVSGESNIKQEMEDIDINDDVESYTSNSNGSDDEFEEIAPMPATITPMIIEDEEQDKSFAVKIASKPSPPTINAATSTTYPRIQIARNLKSATPIPTKAQTTTPSLPISVNAPNISKIQNTTPLSTNVKSTNSTLPFPLFILNPNVSNGVQAATNGSPSMVQKAVTVNPNQNLAGINSDIAKILKDILEVQRENLDIEKQRLEVEKQKLAYERTVGSQLLTIAPFFNDILQKFRPEQVEFITHEVDDEDTKNFEGHPNFERPEAERVSKISNSDISDNLKQHSLYTNVVRKGIKKFINEGGENDTDADSGVND